MKHRVLAFSELAFSALTQPDKAVLDLLTTGAIEVAAARSAKNQRRMMWVLQWEGALERFTIFLALIVATSDTISLTK